MRRFLVVTLLFATPALADTLTLKQVTQDIKAGSTIALLNDTAQDFAENLLAAQLPSVCSYCASEPLSLQDSINSTIKAINLEASFDAKNCDEGSCPIAWSQSNLAIDTNAGITLSSAVVATPEPAVIWLLAAGVLSLFIITRRREYR